MAESTVPQILDLIMRQGEIEANRIKEEARWQEEIKRAKNAWKRNTLKAIATIGPMFIPGLGPFGSLIAGGLGAGAGQMVGSNRGFGDPNDILLQTMQNRF